MANYCIGLDLGQVRDYSALVLAERVMVFDKTSPDRYDFDDRDVVDHFYVRHIQRWALGTPYTTVVDQVCEIARSHQLADALLVIDRTGVGGGVVDLFRQAYRDGQMGDHAPRSLTLTGGTEKGTKAEGSSWSHAGKADVISRLLTLALRDRVKIAATLPLADALAKELRAFTLKQNGRTGNVRYEARREADHDDLVMALALSVWFRHWHDTPSYLSPNGVLCEVPGTGRTHHIGG